MRIVILCSLLAVARCVGLEKKRNNNRHEKSVYIFVFVRVETCEVFRYFEWLHKQTKHDMKNDESIGFQILDGESNLVMGATRKCARGGMGPVLLIH